MSFAVGKMLVKIPFISLPNLIMQKEIFPELLQKQCNAAPLAQKALEWLSPPDGTSPLEDVRAALQDVRLALGEPGAPGRAADCILADLNLLAHDC